MPRRRFRRREHGPTYGLAAPRRSAWNGMTLTAFASVTSPRAEADPRLLRQRCRDD
jgi:hypothetical protein